VYVALGTYSNFREDVYRAAIEAMADEPVQVVVSTGRGILEPADLEPLPANAKAFSFVDSREVLGRARAHITHAGGGSVHESLLAGVPMVCLPQGVDQPLWAQRMHSLGAAETIDVAPQAIKAAVRRLLEDDQPRARADALGQKLISYNGAERAIKLVDRLLAANPATASAT
jgi:MGT family glycosyltransferase